MRIFYNKHRIINVFNAFINASKQKYLKNEVNMNQS